MDVKQLFKRAIVFSHGWVGRKLNIIDKLRHCIENTLEFIFKCAKFILVVIPDHEELTTHFLALDKFC